MFSAPLTSFDWNEVDPNLLGTSSIDTTCTVWGLETGEENSITFKMIYFLELIFRIYFFIFTIIIFISGQVLGRVNMVSGHVKTQLIAHDKEVRSFLIIYQSLIIYHLS